MKLNPVVRATGIIGATAALVTGVTFAALSSSATLTQNTIASATANLEIDNVDEGVETGLSTDQGFAFTGVVPGGTGSNTGNFTLTNTGTAGLTVKVKSPAGPTWVGGSVNDAKVHVNISCTGGLTASITPSITDLLTGDGVAVGGTLAAASTATCTAQVTMESDAFTGTGVSTNPTGFDLVFTGTGV